MRRHPNPPVQEKIKTQNLGEATREALAWIDGQQTVASGLNRGAGETNPMDDMMDDSMETVPATANCTFVGEGRANVVFTLTDVEGRPAFQGRRLF